MACVNQDFGDAARQVHHRLDIVATTDHPSCSEGWSVFLRAAHGGEHNAPRDFTFLAGLSKSLMRFREKSKG